MKFALMLLVACAGRPEISTDGLGTDCAEAECADGQTCHSYAHFECADASCQTCEIACDADSDCPEGLACNLPPVVPDSIPNICE